MIAVTGATGQLGHLVIKSLQDKVPASQIVAVVRNPERAAGLAAQGVQVRKGDYSDPAALEAALQGVDKVLLISSSEVGQRAPQHKNVVDAARKAGVSLLAYTSLLHADKSPMLLAGEHKETEAYIKQSGLPFVLLRNGWYTENHLASIPPSLQHGAFIGSAGEGRFASASRADYADAAAAVLTSPGHAGKTYELAGDEPYTLAEFAAELSRQAGKQVPYVNLPEAEFKNALVGAGLPEAFAGILADSDIGASKSYLFDGSRQLSTLIGRPTTTLSDSIKSALQ